MGPVEQVTMKQVKQVELVGERKLVEQNGRVTDLGSGRHVQQQMVLVAEME